MVVRTTDAEGRVVDTPVTIQIASPVSIRTTRLPALESGRFYTLHGPHDRRRADRPRSARRHDELEGRFGKLPLGLRLNTRTGSSIGTPRKAGTYRFTLEVTDKFKSTDTQAFVAHRQVVADERRRSANGPPQGGPFAF